jgi:hypothetical protein
MGPQSLAMGAVNLVAPSLEDFNNLIFGKILTFVNFSKRILTIRSATLDA